MTPCPALLAQVAAPGRLEMVILRGLAVAGAALVGGLLLGLLGQVARRLTLQKPRPRAIKFLRLTGGLGAGVIAALLLFGSGPGGFGGGPGWGLFGSGGSGSGLGTGPTMDTGRGRTGTAATDTARGQTADSAKATAAEPRPGTACDDSPLRVEVLGDDRVQGERFYRLDGGPLQTLAEVRQHLRQRQKGPAPGGPVQIVLYRNSPNEDKQQVLALRAAAQDLGLAVTLEFLPRDAP